ncbi:hypothetical protein JCM11491_006610 [Sporobolomyces phaffii]
MRAFTLVLALVSTLVLSASADSLPLDEARGIRHDRRAAAAAPGERVGIAFGRPPTQGDSLQARRRNDNGSGGVRRDDGSTSSGAASYLITLERTATNDVKDKILDLLLRSGAVVKQTYDYRVFKGILFTIPANDDKGLTSWQASLGKQEGVKYVEEDLVVKIQ